MSTSTSNVDAFGLFDYLSPAQSDPPAHSDHSDHSVGSNPTDPNDLLSMTARHLATAQELKEKLNYEYPPFEVESGLTRIDPLCTQRQRGMAWHYKTFGIIGLARYIVEIARVESANERYSSTNGARPSSEEHPEPDFAWPPVSDSSQEISESEESEGEASSDDDISEVSDDEPPTVGIDITKKENRSWGLILNDPDAAKEIIIHYLSSLHPELIEALIAGNLPSRMQEEVFNKKISPYTRLRDRQGTYCLYMAAIRQPGGNTQQVLSNTDVGKGLALHEIRQVCDDMRLYIQVDNFRSAKIAKRIDRQFSGASPLRKTLDYSFQRRYGSGGGHDKFRFHDSWLDFIEIHYIHWANAQTDPQLLRQRLERCFVYAGLASNVEGRAPNHWKHLVGTSPMIGLFAATLQYRYPDQFSLQQHTYQIFKTVDRAHIGIDEKLTTILSSAYSWDGGLSVVLAGNNRGSGAKDFSSEKASQFALSRQEIDSSEVRKRNLDESEARISKAREAFEAIKVVQTGETKLDMEIEDLVTKCQANINEANKLVEMQKTSEEQNNLHLQDQDCLDMLALLQEYEDAPVVSHDHEMSD